MWILEGCVLSIGEQQLRWTLECPHLWNNIQLRSSNSFDFFGELLERSKRVPLEFGTVIHSQPPHTCRPSVGPGVESGENAPKVLY